MIKGTFTGNLLADPELNYAQNDRGTEYVTIRVGLNKKKGETKLFAVADVTIYKFTQEAMERLHTGSRVLITGDFFPDFFEQRDGKIVAKIDVVADAWEDLSPREGTSQGQGHGRTQAPQQQQQQNGGYGRRPAQNGNGRTGANNRPRTGGNNDRRPARQF